MSFGIQIGTEYLDLPPDTSLELESDNPFLQFADGVVGKFSLPIEVRATPKNVRLLGYASVLQQKVNNTGIDAIVINKSQQTRGKIKIERANINLNRPGAGSISIFFLTDASYFASEANNIRLRDINVGGDRTFAGGPPDGLLNSEFGEHVNAVLNAAPGSYDYAFYPVFNSLWGEDGLNGIPRDTMNQIFANISTGIAEIVQGPIVPFPYLKYVLLKAVEHVGWRIQGDILDDPDFEKITMINFRSIDWGYVISISFGKIFQIHDTVTFNLQDHLPDLSVSEFLLELQNRFAWWYDFDSVSKTIYIKKRKDLVTLTQRDMTRYASPLIPKKVLQDSRVYALKNSFVTGGGEGIDLTKVDYQGEVDKVSDLPTAAEAMVNHVYLVIEENNFYICIQNYDDESWSWEIHSANIYDYLPAGYNEEITTKATTVEMVRKDDYMDLIPRVDSPGIWTGVDGETPWGIHLCFFFGLRENKEGDEVPFASHHIYDSTGVKLADWSLAFKAKKIDGSEVGLYDLEWKPFIDLFENAEEFEATLFLPYHEYLKIHFSDTIVISNTKMFISKLNSAIPYQGQVKVEAIRIL